jgi:hypothetical protein
MDRGQFDEFNPMHLYTYSTTYQGIRDKFNLMLRETQKGYWDHRTELARINYLELMDDVIGNDPVGKILIKQIKSMPLSDFKRVLLEDDDLFPHLYDLAFSMSRNPDFVHSEKYNTLLETVFHEWNPGMDMGEALDEYLAKKGKN